MTTSTAPADTLPLLQAILNLSKFHREHEKFYASGTARVRGNPATPRPQPAGTR